jgi:hypothetical protein
MIASSPPGFQATSMRLRFSVAFFFGCQMPLE